MTLSKLLSKPKRKIALLLIAPLLSVQALPSRATAEKKYERATAPFRLDERQNGDLDSPQSKLAPDLQESVEEVAVRGHADKKQRVIIQLRSATPLNDGDEADSVTQQIRDEMIEGDARANEMRAPVMRAKIERLQGRFGRSLNRLGLISAVLPLSKIRELENDPEVAYISPDRPVESFGHIEKTVGAGDSDGRTEAGNLTNCDGTGVGIAVLDSGIDDTHNLIKTTSSHPGIVYSKTYTGLAANRDYYGHGTHVATILDGDRSFKSGAYAGIAYDAKIISLAVLDNQGKGLSSNVVAALDWCIANKSTYNIRVINMSLGTPPKDTYTTDPLCLASRRAHNAGIVVVASAGNNGKDSLGRKLYGGINSPGIDPSVITVGATNSYGTDLRSDDAMASYSSHGPTRSYKLVNGIRKYDNQIKPDIVAPGNKVIGACSPSSVGQTYSLVTQMPSLLCGSATVAADQVMYMSGTSMSTPVVAGAAAMLIESNPNLTPSLVKAILMYTAQPIQGVNTLEQGAGRLNVEGAVQVAWQVVSNCASLSNGATLLTSPIGVSIQTDNIAGELCTWGRGIVTNYGFLYGSDLINKWQAAYAQGRVLDEATPYTSGQLTRSTTLTSSGVSLYAGAITNSGVLLSDGSLLSNSTLLADGTLLSAGVLIADGVLLSDGVLISDGVLLSDSVFGDNTARMQPAP